MTQVILTAKAREDLLRLREFLVWKNPIAAKKATAILVEAIDGLAEFPETEIQSIDFANNMLDYLKEKRIL